MLEFLGTFHGAVSAAIVCATILVITFRLTGKYNGVEIGGGKVKFDGTKEAEKTMPMKIIRFDDWKYFSIELYEFCIKLLKPEENHLYAILHNYEDVLSPSKKAYVERFLYFNHLPEYKTEKYKEYISVHSNAMIISICRSMKLICHDYTKETPEFDSEEICKALSRLIEKYRDKKKGR